MGDDINEHMEGSKKSISKYTFECSYKFIVETNGDIDREVKQNILNFMDFIESEYSLKTPLNIDFFDKDYLVDRTGKKVGYIFYWLDLKKYPNIYSEDEFPSIELPVSKNKWSVDEILTSFIEALSMYYAWCLNIMHDNYEVDDSLVDSILKEYRRKYPF